MAQIYKDLHAWWCCAFRYFIQTSVNRCKINFQSSVFLQLFFFLKIRSEVVKLKTLIKLNNCLAADLRQCSTLPPLIKCLFSRQRTVITRTSSLTDTWGCTCIYETLDWGDRSQGRTWLVIAEVKFGKKHCRVTPWKRSLNSCGRVWSFFLLLFHFFLRIASKRSWAAFSRNMKWTTTLVYWWRWDDTKIIRSSNNSR